MADRIRVQKGVHIYRRAGAPTWYADICTAGQRFRRSTGTEDEEEASRVARGFLAGSKQVVAAGYTLDHAYADWLKERPRSETDKSALRKLRELYSNRPAHQVDNGSVADALAGLGPGNYNRIIAVLRAALNLAAERGKIKKAPKLSKKEEPPGRVRFLTPEEWTRLRAELPEHTLAAVEFALATGQRRANVLKIRWSQVDMHAKLLHLPATSMKSRKAHTIPLGVEAMRILKAQEGKHKTAVFSYRGKPVADLKKSFNAAVVRAGLEDFTWHDLRHTWASWMAMSGAPLHAIKEAGAWATMDMVARYSHLTPSALATYQDRAVKALKRIQQPVTAKRKPRNHAASKAKPHHS